MVNFTIITTINPITPAISMFEKFVDWKLVVVGDMKSHPIAETRRLTFLCMDTQHKLGLDLSIISPLNHYARKNIGYLYAIKQGARIIYDTDDDNMPLENWTIPKQFTCDVVADNPSKFVNIYRHFTDEHIWPRGFPLDEIANPPLTNHKTSLSNIGVWQGLADSDPDVDAIWRLVFNKRIAFRHSEPVYLSAGQYCPFNSQNTFWSKETFPLLYLPTTVRFRFTDILRGYIAQRLMWENACHLGFMAPSVWQERNPHDYLDDFQDEIDCYLQVKPLVRILDSLSLTGDYHRDLYSVYSALLHNGLVAASELDTLNAWLRDLESLSGWAERHG